MTTMTYRGTSAASLGVVVLEYPPIVKARAAVETISIPGRSGYLTLHAPAAYEPVEKTVRGYLTAAASQEVVSAWLTGGGALVLGNEPTYAYTARVIEAVEFAKIVPGRRERAFEVTFMCQPYKVLAVPGADITLSTNPQTITSLATLDSPPLIIVTGTGNITINVGIYAFTLAAVSPGTPLYVDCESMTVTNEAYSVSYINKMTGQFPVLTPGDNVLSHTGTVASIVVKPRYRWL